MEIAGLIIGVVMGLTGCAIMLLPIVGLFLHLNRHS